MNIYRIWRSNFVQLRLSKFVPRRIISAAKYLYPEMAYTPQGWQRDPEGSGWRGDGVVEAQEEHWPILLECLQGLGPLGVAHFPWSVTREDQGNHNTMMSYGYVLALASRKKDRISILDWGGGAGHYYLYSKVLLPEMAIDYHCFDLPRFCQLGKKLTPEAHYHHLDAELIGQRFDLVLSSSSLHYCENWRETARQLAALTAEFLYIARLQTVARAPSFAAVHRVYRAGYTEFPTWCLNRKELVDCVEDSGLKLVREFVYADTAHARGAPDKIDSRGFLFRRMR